MLFIYSFSFLHKNLLHSAAFVHKTTLHFYPQKHLRLDAFNRSLALKLMSIQALNSENYEMKRRLHNTEEAKGRNLTWEFIFPFILETMVTVSSDQTI